MQVLEFINSPAAMPGVVCLLAIVVCCIFATVASRWL